MINNNGNYTFFKIEDLKDNLIETFEDVLGAEYSDHITEVITSTKFFPFHSLKYQNKKYLEHIRKYEDEIIGNLYAKLKLPRNNKTDKYFRLNNNGEILIDNIVHYNYDYLGSVNKNYESQESIDAFNECCNDLNIQGTKEDKQRKLDDIYRTYNEVVEEIRRKYDCDIFRFYRKYQEFLLSDTKRYLKYAYQLDLLSEEDYNKLNNEDFKYEDLKYLDAYGRLFIKDVRVGGLIENFVDFDNDSSKISNYTMISRLKYMYLQGVEPRFITRENLDQMFKDDSLIDEKLLHKEYKYQSNMNSFYMVDSRDANNLFKFRKELNMSLEHASKFASSNVEHLSHFDGDYYVSNYCEDFNINNPKFRMILNCDPTLSNKTLLSNLIHELLHNLGYFNYMKIGNNKYFRQCGVQVNKIYTDSNGKILYLDDKYDANLLEEYCNEMISKIATNRYIEKFGVPSLIEDGGEDWKHCTYDYYDVIFRDFFDAFKEEIILTKVHNKNLFNNKDYPEDVIESLIYKVYSKVGRVLKFKPEGRIDLDLYMKLVELIPDFEVLVNKVKRKCEPEQMYDMDFMQTLLDSSDYSMYQRILNKKDKIMSQMIRKSNPIDIRQASM